MQKSNATPSRILAMLKLPPAFSIPRSADAHTPADLRTAQVGSCSSVTVAPFGGLEEPPVSLQAGPTRAPRLSHLGPRRPNIVRARRCLLALQRYPSSYMSVLLGTHGCSRASARRDPLARMPNMSRGG
jgi:hypothetical protein